jgi:hypothetical protein
MHRYSHKLMELVQRVLKRIVRFPVQPDRFAVRASCNVVCQTSQLLQMQRPSDSVSARPIVKSADYLFQWCPAHGFSWLPLK